MPAFVEKYTQQQRDAMAYAFEDRKIRPASRVVELAARGELTLNGEKLDPFDANEDSVRHYARDYRKARHGLTTSELARLPHRDATEALRRRLINAADSLLAHYERVTKRSPDKADPERLRQIARAVMEIERLDPNPETRRSTSGARDTAGKKGPETKGGLAGALLTAHRTAAKESPLEAGRARRTVPSRSAMRS